MVNDKVTVVKAFLEMLLRDGMSPSAEKYGGAGFTWWVQGVGELQNFFEPFERMLKEHLTEAGMDLKLLYFTAEDDRVSVEAASRATLKNGAVCRNRYHFMFTVRDTKIVAIREYNDTAHAETAWNPMLQNFQSQYMKQNT
jgi:uncharacterized protein